MKKIVWLLVAATLAVAGIVVMMSAKTADVPSPLHQAVADPVDADATPSSRQIEEVESVDGQVADAVSSECDVRDDESDEPETEEEKAAAAEEAKVEAFDNLTDKWMEPSKTGVTMKDVDAFVKTFRQVPKERQDECVHRALNLIPDENVMLLAGILMDKTMDKEIVETVFNDILNRDEDVKKPIMKEIFKDKTHPCWTDVAWIFDVTGETKE